MACCQAFGLNFETSLLLLKTASLVVLYYLLSVFMSPQYRIQFFLRNKNVLSVTFNVGHSYAAVLECTALKGFLNRFVLVVK